MKNITINELQVYSGIKAHTIRIWEKRYNLLQPLRTTGNIRYYSLDQTKAFLDLALLNKNGYKISKLANMSVGERTTRVSVMCDPESAARKALHELLLAYLREDLEAVESIVDLLVQQRDDNDLVCQVLFPFAQMTTLLWCENRILSSFEGLIFEVINRKIILITERLVANRKQGTALMVVLPLQQNELPLVFATYFLSKKGYQCYTIKGTSHSPLATLKILKPSLLVSAVLRKKDLPLLAVWGKALTNYLSPSQILIIGEAFSSKENILSPLPSKLLEELSSLKSKQSISDKAVFE